MSFFLHVSIKTINVYKQSIVIKIYQLLSCYSTILDQFRADDEGKVLIEKLTVLYQFSIK